MSEIKHTMPDVIYAFFQHWEDQNWAEHIDMQYRHNQSGCLSGVSYTRTDIVQELVEALDDLVSHYDSKDGDMKLHRFFIEKAQQALNKAKGVGDGR